MAAPERSLWRRAEVRVMDLREGDVIAHKQAWRYVYDVLDVEDAQERATEDLGLKFPMDADSRDTFVRYALDDVTAGGRRTPELFDDAWVLFRNPYELVTIQAVE